MMKRTSTLHRLTQTALIAALYAVLTLVLPIASFGTVQLRFSEALTLLPVVNKRAIGGLTLGCAIANAVGVAMGANIAGAWDILIGASATLIAAGISYVCRRIRIKDVPILSALAPIIVNGVIVGAELTWVVLDEFSPGAFWLMAGQVALGEIVPCLFGGVLLVKVLEKTGLAVKIFSE